MTEPGAGAVKAPGAYDEPDAVNVREGTETRRAIQRESNRPSMVADTPKDRRAQIAACVGFGLQLVLFFVCYTVGAIYHSPAIRAQAIHLGFGVFIWLTLFLLYTQRKRSGVEQLETEELKRSREGSGETGLFSLEEESLLVQRRRLNWMYRWFLPAVALLLAIGLLAWNGWWYYLNALPIKDPRWKYCANPQRALPFVVGVTFLCFLYSRYVGGMARRPEWRFLRAASSYLAGNALMGLGVILALALAIYQVPYAEPVVTYVVRLAILVLGIEFLVNFILDFYRPRLAGEETRPAFDSRLLGLIGEPGGIARSIQEAINYQFGFEVSATWFYQLLKRSLLPLAVFALLVMIGLSSIVIVDADEQAFVVHSGKLVQSPDKPLEPGLHFRWPWPIDRVERERVRQLRHMTVGEAAEEEQHEDEHEHQRAILWTQEHEYVPEMMLVVASPQLTDLGSGPTSNPAGSALAPGQSAPPTARGKSVAVSLIMASVVLEYRVADLFKFRNTYVHPEKVIENIAHQALADYAAGIDIHRIMGPGREEFNQRLRERLQNRLNELQLGVELTFVGLQDAHPPSKDEVAQKFQDVIAAKSRKEAAIQAAVGQAERTLTKVAGSRERASALDAAVMALERLSAGSQSDDAVAAAWRRIEELMLGNPERSIAPMSGEASAAVAAARGQASKMVSEAESKARTFENELAAFRAAPRLYKMRRYLEAMRTCLEKIRKVVNASQEAELIIIIETEKRSEFELPEEGKN